MDVTDKVFLIYILGSVVSCLITIIIYLTRHIKKTFDVDDLVIILVQSQLSWLGVIIIMLLHIKLIFENDKNSKKIYE